MAEYRYGRDDVVYIQITLTDQVETDLEVDKFVNNRPLCFLICVLDMHNYLLIFVICN